MTGRKPKPTTLKILTGNPGRRPLNTREPKPKMGVPGMPSWLSKEAKAEWRRVAGELHKTGVLALIDRGCLASYCQASAELVEATRILEAEGRIVSVPITRRCKVDGEWTVEVIGEKHVAHPAVKLQRTAFVAVKALSVELGLTPLSRPRLKSDHGGKEEDPMETFLSGKAKA